jgi:hypothetical protein
MMMNCEGKPWNIRSIDCSISSTDLVNLNHPMEIKNVLQISDYGFWIRT